MAQARPCAKRSKPSVKPTRGPKKLLRLLVDNLGNVILSGAKNLLAGVETLRCPSHRPGVLRESDISFMPFVVKEFYTNSQSAVESPH